MPWTSNRVTSAGVIGLFAASSVALAIAMIGARASSDEAERDAIARDPSLSPAHLVVVPGDDTSPAKARSLSASSRHAQPLDVDRSLAPDYKPLTAQAAPLDRDDPWSVANDSRSPHARVELDRANPWTGRPFD